MVNIISSSFQFCFEGGERSTCFCFTFEVVANAYPPVCKAFLSRGCPQQEHEELILSYVAPYFEYQTAYEIILLAIQALHYEEPYRRSFRFLYESVG